MFLGTHTPRLDEKGRLFLPAKYRERMAGGLVVTRGQERCLYIYPDGRVRPGRRADAPGPHDEQGRPRLHPRLPLRRLRRGPRQAGPLHHPGQPAPVRRADRECTVIGAGSRLEVWDTAVWNTYLESTEQGFADPSEEVIPGLF